MNLKSLSQKNPIVLFDGVCNLCNGAVQFIIKNDKREIFLFAPIQRLGNDYHVLGIDTKNLSTVFLMQNGTLFKESEAILRICKQLRFPINLLFSGIILPAFIRDAMYKYVAKNRYRWFGKKDQCMLPTPALKARFL